MSRWQISVSSVSLALFAFACATTAGHAHGGFAEDGVEPAGWQLLLFGWLLLPLAGFGWLTWLANPFFVLALTYLWTGRYRAATTVSAICAGLGLLPLVMLGGFGHVRLESPMALVFAEGRLQLRLGYFAWVGSYTALCLGAAAAWNPLQLARPTTEGGEPMKNWSLCQVCPLLSGGSIVVGGAGMVMSFFFMASASMPDITAGTSGFIAGAVLVGSGLIALALCASRPDRAQSGSSQYADRQSA
jgi:hypothetical protein